jgi:hypothetical protein
MTLRNTILIRIPWRLRDYSPRTQYHALPAGGIDIISWSNLPTLSNHCLKMHLTKRTGRSSFVIFRGDITLGIPLPCLPGHGTVLASQGITLNRTLLLMKYKQSSTPTAVILLISQSYHVNQYMLCFSTI